MPITKNIVIIGAGPVGLYFATKCEEAKLDYCVLEGSSEPGGQLTHLYPEKEIVDIKGIASIKSKDYIKELLAKINSNNLILNERVLDIEPGENIKITTANSVYFCKNLVISTGLGASLPRPLGVDHEDEADNIIYNLSDFEFLANKKVAIFGGGDSALDWAKQLSKISDNVHLIHRRTEFRGNPETIKNCNNLNVHLPYVPKSITIQNRKVTKVTIQKVDTSELEDIDVDYIFVNYGNIAQQSSFPFPMTGSFLNVDNEFRITKNIFAIGDVANYENKTRRIAPGNIEADKVFDLIRGF